MVLSADLNGAAMSLLSTNFPIYGDVLLIRIIEGFIFDATFDEIASDLITEISVSDAPIANVNMHSADLELTHMTNPAMVGSDVSSDEYEYDEMDEYEEGESYDSN